MCRTQLPSRSSRKRAPPIRYERGDSSRTRTKNGEGVTFEKSEANGRITDPGRFIEIDVVKPAVDAVSSDPMPYGYYGYC